MTLLQANQVQVRRGVFQLDFDLQVGACDCVALVGPNGCGKTSLLQVLAGRVPFEGQVSIGGHSLRDERAQALSQVGYAVAPEVLPGALTGTQALELVANAYGIRVDDAVLAIAGEMELKNLDGQIGYYSLGMRQKLSLLLALVPGISGVPTVLLLDEVFNGIDFASAAKVDLLLNQHRERGGAVVLATHSLQIVERCANRLVLLDTGRIRCSWDAAQYTEACAAGLEAALVSASAN